MNNVVRVAIEALAAVIGGTQSLQTCSYDEGIDIPTAEAQRLALRTQQIIAHETGATNVADPLGGSFYIEDLTDRLEERILKVIKEVEDRGGHIEAMCSEWVETKLRQLALQQQQKVENNERVIVGVNAYTDDSEGEKPVEPFKLPEGEVERHLDNLRDLRSRREKETVKGELEKLGEMASKEGVNLTEQVLNALKAGATSGEIAGYVRMAYGYPYDIMHTIECPF
jgi:methylmalonyl-CoA mutase N-terminal domain/subunit